MVEDPAVTVEEMAVAVTEAAMVVAMVVEREVAVTAAAKAVALAVGVEAAMAAVGVAVRAAEEEVLSLEGRVAAREAVTAAAMVAAWVVAMAAVALARSREGRAVVLAVAVKAVMMAAMEAVKVRHTVPIQAQRMTHGICPRKCLYWLDGPAACMVVRNQRMSQSPSCIGVPCRHMWHKCTVGRLHRHMAPYREGNIGRRLRKGSRSCRLDSEVAGEGMQAAAARAVGCGRCCGWWRQRRRRGRRRR